MHRKAESFSKRPIPLLYRPRRQRREAPGGRRDVRLDGGGATTQRPSAAGKPENVLNRWTGVGILIELLLGVLTVLVITALTGWFVAQEFGYLAVDRSRLTARASAGDRGARRALGITSRTSFLLSGAQLGITVTGLLVGYLAEPMIGRSLAAVLGWAGVGPALGLAVGTALALLLATAVQMVFGELLPKNLAIARPEPVARRLAWSTAGYLRVFGPLIRLFDRSAELLVRALGIEPVHDVRHAATPADLEHIVRASGRGGELPEELSLLLERVLEFHERTAQHAVVPRTSVVGVRAEQPVGAALALMAGGRSRLPVYGRDGDDVVGVVHLADLLGLVGAGARDGRTVGGLARPALLLPGSLPLVAVRERLRGSGAGLGCVLDEFGGLAGVITEEDLAEELVGEIRDEHDRSAAPTARRVGPDWEVDGALPVDELARLLRLRLPDGEAQTVGGLVVAALGRLPATGDTVRVALPAPPGAGAGPAELALRVLRVDRRVPASVRVRPASPAEGGR
jgi:CBS domain containing-hemolysin-like protein